RQWLRRSTAYTRCNYRTYAGNVPLGNNLSVGAQSYSDGVPAGRRRFRNSGALQKMADQLEPIMTITEAAEHMRCTPRKVRDRLRHHGIPTIGRGRGATLAASDLARLIEAEKSNGRYARQESAGQTGLSGGPTTARDSSRQHLHAKLRQLRREWMKS